MQSNKIFGSDHIALISAFIHLNIKIVQVRCKLRCSSLWALNNTAFCLSQTFLTQLSPNVPRQQRNRQRRREKKNYKDRKKRTNKQNSSWSPKALMKREFSSLSENFSPLQRLACISKVTASVCSFVCVCVFSCCPAVWGVKAGGGCAGDTRRLCVSVRVWVCACVCVSEWTPAGLEQQPEPPKRTPGLSGRWRAGVASHLVLQEVPGGRVYLCMSMCVCDFRSVGGGDSHQTCLPTN